ncbi:MAG TPA: cation diffusion facilitator family transporter [Pseudonocardia sp.]
MSAGSSSKAIVAALTANLGIAVAKFIGWLFTGSSSMLAESVHSVVDTTNQGLLLVGRKRASREPDAVHPFGYGRDRFFYSFVVALLLFSLGAVFSVYEGAHKIADPHPVEAPAVALAILLVAVVLEGFSFRTALRESRPFKGERSWWGFIQDATEPELPVVVLEDFGALVGLVLALLGVGLSMLTGDGRWDGVGTVCIGLLLGVIAVILIVEMKSLLLGEGADANTVALITEALEAGRVERMIHIRTQYLSPDELLVGAKIALTPGLTIEDVAAAIDDAEQRIRAAVPQATLIYLEPDLDRTPR